MINDYFADFSPYTSSIPSQHPNETNFEVWFTGKPFRSGRSFPKLPSTSRRKRETEALLRGGTKHSKFKVESTTEMKVLYILYIYIPVFIHSNYSVIFYTHYTVIVYIVA